MKKRDYFMLDDNYKKLQEATDQIHLLEELGEYIDGRGRIYTVRNDKQPAEEKHMERKYCGKTWDEMMDILSFMCDLEDRVKMSKKEQEMYDIAMRCVTTVINRMKNDNPIAWD